MVNNTLFNFSWEKYLTMLFVLLGVGFFTSGVVTWVAANWDYFSKFQKLYALQFWLTVSVLLSLFFYVQEAKKSLADNKKIVSSAGFFVSAVFIGALLALIGQIYQTGADVWQLFGVWSALQIPFFLILPNIGNALLLGATLNITLTFFVDTNYSSNYAFLSAAGLNFVLSLLAELYVRKTGHESWKIVVKIANVALAIALVGTALSGPYRWESGVNQAVIAWLVSGGLLVFYKMRSDMFLSIVYFVSTVVNFDIFLIRDSYDLASLFVALTVTLVAIVFSGIQIKKWFLAANPQLESNWLVQIMFAFLAVVASLLMLGYLFLLQLDDEIILLIVGLIAFAIAGVLHQQKQQDYLADTLFAISGILIFTYFVVHGEIRSQGDFTIALVGMAIYLVLIYYLRATLWLRSLAVLLFIFSLFLEFSFYDFSIYEAGEKQMTLLEQLFGYSVAQWLMLGTIILFYVKERYRDADPARHITPVAWAFLLSAFWFYLLQHFNTLRWFEQVDGLPQIKTFADLFHVLTGNIFINASLKFWIYYGFYFAVCLLPVLLFLILSRTFKFNPVNSLVIAIIIALFSLAFVSMNLIAFSLALLLVAYINSGRVLFALAVLSLLSALSTYYYMLAVPLLYKSFLLLAFGVIFIGLSILLYTQWKTSSEPAESAVENQPVFKLKPILTLLSLVGVLGLANHSIVKYEDVLANGKSIILKLAPVDPRSLMQGDFMLLNYAILDQVREQLEGEPEETRYDYRKRHAYLLLKQDAQGIATFCRLEFAPPAQFDSCQADVYLPLNITGRWPQLPTHSYFFAEGKGPYYAQAQYGEYRFKNGKALLYRLLDENLKPL